MRVRRSFLVRFSVGSPISNQAGFHESRQAHCLGTRKAGGAM